MLALKITAFGASVGVILPEEALTELRVRQGDMLYLTRAAEGGYWIMPHDPAFAAQMQAAEDIMYDDREILSQLAK